MSVAPVPRRRRVACILSVLLVVPLIVPGLPQFPSSPRELSRGYNYTTGIATDGSYIYFAESDGPCCLYWGISRVPVTGGQPENLVANQTFVVGPVVDAGYVYWIGWPGFPSGGPELFRMPSTGGAPQFLATAELDPMTVSDGFVYFISDGALVRTSTHGGTVWVLAQVVGCSTYGPPNTLVVSGGFVYISCGPQVVRTPVEGGETTTLATSPYPPASQSCTVLGVDTLAVSGGRVYWIRNYQSNGTYYVALSSAKVGGGDPEDLSTWRFNAGDYPCPTGGLLIYGAWAFVTLSSGPSAGIEAVRIGGGPTTTVEENVPGTGLCLLGQTMYFTDYTRSPQGGLWSIEPSVLRYS